MASSPMTRRWLSAHWGGVDECRPNAGMQARAGSEANIHKASFIERRLFYSLVTSTSSEVSIVL